MYQATNIQSKKYEPTEKELSQLNDINLAEVNDGKVFLLTIEDIDPKLRMPLVFKYQDKLNIFVSKAKWLMDLIDQEEIEPETIFTLLGEKHLKTIIIDNVEFCGIFNSSSDIIDFYSAEELLTVAKNLKELTNIFQAGRMGKLRNEKQELFINKLGQTGLAKIIDDKEKLITLLTSRIILKTKKLVIKTLGKEILLKIISDKENPLASSLNSHKDGAELCNYIKEILHTDITVEKTLNSDNSKIEIPGLKNNMSSESMNILENQTVSNNTINTTINTEIISEKKQNNENSSLEIQSTSIINQTNTINSEESSPLNKNPVSYLASKDGTQLADVPADGNCFYIALTLSLILPAIQEENDYAKRVKLLWPEVTNTQLMELKKELIQYYLSNKERPEELSETPILQNCINFFKDNIKNYIFENFQYYSGFFYDVENEEQKWLKLDKDLSFKAWVDDYIRHAIECLLDCKTAIYHYKPEENAFCMQIGMEHEDPNKIFTYYVDLAYLNAGKPYNYDEMTCPRNHYQLFFPNGNNLVSHLQILFQDSFQDSFQDKKNDLIEKESMLNEICNNSTQKINTLLSQQQIKQTSYEEKRKLFIIMLESELNTQDKELLYYPDPIGTELTIVCAESYVYKKLSQTLDNNIIIYNKDEECLMLTIEIMQNLKNIILENKESQSIVEHKNLEQKFPFFVELCISKLLIPKLAQLTTEITVNGEEENIQNFYTDHLESLDKNKEVILPFNGSAIIPQQLVEAYEQAEKRIRENIRRNSKVNNNLVNNKPGKEKNNPNKKSEEDNDESGANINGSTGNISPEDLNLINLN